jgi:hypothetical protein
MRWIGAMPAAVTTAATALQVIPAAEHKIACLDCVINILNQRCVATMLAGKVERLFRRAGVKVVVDSFADKQRQTFRAVTGPGIFNRHDRRVAAAPAACRPLLRVTGKSGVTCRTLFCWRCHDGLCIQFFCRSDSLLLRVMTCNSGSAQGVDCVAGLIECHYK